MRFEWTRKEADLDPHPIVGHVIQAEDVEKFPHALGFESLDFFFFSVNKQGPCLTAMEEEDGGDERLVQLELACLADGVALPDPESQSAFNQNIPASTSTVQTQ